MSFVVTAPVTPEEETEIANGDFWPAIDPAKVRVSFYLDGTITAQRLRDALIEAMATVNDELTAWADIKMAEGHATLAAVPCSTLDNEPILVLRYRRAVGCLAKAMLIERYRDYDTTGKGDRKADVLENPIDDLRRDYRWAISDILGVGRSTVELI